MNRISVPSTLLLLALAATASANSITLAPTSPEATGSVTAVTGNSAPGFEVDSWRETGPGKAEIYISPMTLFGHDVTIGELASITYWTNKPGSGADPDWTLILYTKPTGSGDSAPGYYHSRLNAEPYFTSSTVTSNTWHQWSTDGSNPLRFYDQPRNGTFGSYSDPNLNAFRDGPVNWQDYGYGAGPTIDYSGEQIGAFSIQTGSAWANGFTGLLDGLEVTLVDNIGLQTKLDAGELGSVNFEGVVPVELSGFTVE
jgi:hypothetical protein